MAETTKWDFVTVCLRVFLCVRVHEKARDQPQMRFPRSPWSAPSHRFFCLSQSLTGMDSAGTLGCLVSRLQGSSPCFYTCVPPHLALHTSVLGSNRGPHVHKVSTSLAEPSPSAWQHDFGGKTMGTLGSAC